MKEFIIYIIGYGLTVSMIVIAFFNLKKKINQIDVML